jgi:hypothetical protein
METQNITLALPKRVLRKVRLIAFQRNTSVSRMLTTMLEQLVAESDEYERARRRQLALMEKGLPLAFNKDARWSREDLHER